jgi:hypothetical protein
MTRKLFIVDPANERVYAALRTALANESGVEVVFDRRNRALHLSKWTGAERRKAGDDAVGERIRTDGFAVVRPVPPPAPERNIRWA